MRKKVKIDQTFVLKVSDKNELVIEELPEKFEWIRNLPRGEYDMKFLKEYSGLTWHKSIKQCLMNHGAQVRQIKARGNLSKDIFTWAGYKTIKEVKEIQEDPLKTLEHIHDIESVKVEGYLETLWGKK